MRINRNRSKIRQQSHAIGQRSPTGNVDTILANMFKGILDNININSGRFNVLMEQFLADRRNALPQNIRDRSVSRGNLRKELLKNTMTWKVFCKGLRFINVVKFELNISLHHSNRRVTAHRCVVNLGEFADGDAGESSESNQD